MNKHITMTSQLARAVTDSRLLLTHAAHAGLTLDDATLTTLVEAQYRQDAEEWTNENEAAFWQAFSNLNVLVKPVTLESLKAVSQLHDHAPLFKFFRFFNKSYRAAGLYTFLSLTFMALLLTAQMYWLIGEKLSQHLIRSNEQVQQLQQRSGFEEGRFVLEYDALRMAIETTRETLVLWSQPWVFALSSVDNDFSQPYGRQEELTLDIATVREQLKDAANRLTAFKDFQFDDAGQELNAVYRARVDALTEALIQHKSAYEQAENEKRFIETELRTHYVLNVVQRYLLPVLYGLLGATAYVLRSLITAIQQETYTGRANTKYRMRLFLGALSGLLIGFFIVPNGTNSLAALSPMALSFLSGYNVEVLFLAMDQFIDAVIEKIKQRTMSTEQ